MLRRNAKRRRYPRAIRRVRETRTRDSRRGRNETACATRVARDTMKRVHRERSLRGTCYTTVTNLVTVRCTPPIKLLATMTACKSSVNYWAVMPTIGKVEESFYIIVRGFFLVLFESFSLSSICVLSEKQKRLFQRKYSTSSFLNNNEFKYF